MIRYDDPQALPLLLHLNSEPWMNLDAYAAQSAEVPFPTHAAAADCVTLPQPSSSGRDNDNDNDSNIQNTDALPQTLSRTIAQRRSWRSFEPRPLPLELLSQLLMNSYGVQGMVELPDGVRVLQRPVPSAGALYPLELHLCLRNIIGAADGVYRYEPLHHRLEPKGPLPPDEELAAMLMAQVYAVQANVLVILVGSLQRTLSKYGMRGYRYLLLEAGHVAQNLSLLGVEAGLCSLCLGGFRDRLVNRWLNLDDSRRVSLYGLALGWPRHHAGDG